MCLKYKMISPVHQISASHDHRLHNFRCQREESTMISVLQDASQYLAEKLTNLQIRCSGISEGMKLLNVLAVSQNSHANHKNGIKCSLTICPAFATHSKERWKDALHTIQLEALRCWDDAGEQNVCVTDW